MSNSVADGGVNRREFISQTVALGGLAAVASVVGPSNVWAGGYSNPTAAMPSTACGTRMLHALTPKIRALSAMTHSEAGVLSTVIAFEASKDPNSMASQFCEPAMAAAE